MIGMVLAAGAGKRLGSLTEDLPKTLLEVDGERTILDVALGNFAAVGLEEAVIVPGFAAEGIDERLDALSDRYGLALRTVFNPKALEWNNAYSLWCARDEFARGVLLANGDTVHPSSVEESLLSGRNGDDLVIALDRAKTLGEEEMKVHLTDEGLLDGINKSLDPATAAGLPIGVALVDPHAPEKLPQGPQAPVERAPPLYQLDGFPAAGRPRGRVPRPALGDGARG